MHSKVFSATTIGVEAHLIEVEADLSFGLMNFCIVGLADKAIKESKDRIRAALKNSGLKLPDRLITINLAPADLKKQDTLLDVPIAVSIMQAAKMVSMKADFISQTVFIGELSLDGKIRPVKGILSMVDGAKKAGKKRILIPEENKFEASLIKGIDVLPVKHLSDLVAYLRFEKDLELLSSKNFSTQKEEKNLELDFSQVKGQVQAKRALQIAAAGGHNILFVGPPGAGKTMLAKRFSTILPALSSDQIIDVTKIYSIAGLLSGKNLISKRPFRSPHHTVSQAGLAGGGSNPSPGEISLAHHGVLFLDELTEFSRTAIETLRQPLESENIVISRAASTIKYPAKFILVAALNPCPCGYFGDENKKCVCTENQISKYLSKLSGPILDRIDIHVNVSSVKYSDLKSLTLSQTSSEKMSQEIKRALSFSRQRGQEKDNSKLDSSQVLKSCVLEEEAERILQVYFKKFNMSARSYHKVLKVSRTIADFNQSQKIKAEHVKEAVGYRFLDKKF